MAAKKRIPVTCDDCYFRQEGLCALALDGTVIPIGGVKQKTIGARRADVDLFLVPAGENARDARANVKGLPIIPVESFQQALRKLATNRVKC